MIPMKRKKYAKIGTESAQNQSSVVRTKSVFQTDGDATMTTTVRINQMKRTVKITNANQDTSSATPDIALRITSGVMATGTAWICRMRRTAHRATLKVATARLSSSSAT